MRQYVPFSMLNVWDSQYQHHRDVLFIQVRAMVQMSKVSKFFIRTTDDPVMYDTYLYGLRVGDFKPSLMQVVNCQRRDTRYTHASREDPIYGEIFPDREILLPESYLYDCSYTLG